MAASGRATRSGSDVEPSAPGGAAPTGRGSAPGAAAAIARRTVRDARTRTTAFALIFLTGSAAQGASYRSAYPTLADRENLARTFGSNKAVRLLYGVPHDLLTVGGFMSWRLGALTIFGALFGVLAAVRALRAEEEAGRQDIVLSGVVGRATAYRAALTGVAATALIVWLGVFVGVLAGRAGVGGSAYLALALMSPLPVFVGIGAVASQIAPTRRIATTIGSGTLAVALMLRMAADTSSAGWLRWTTPLGWAEELRPFVGAQPLVLLLPAAATAALLLAAEHIATRRDIGRGLLTAHDSVPPRYGLLSSPTALALRTLRGSLLGWLIGLGALAVLMGVISDSVASGLSQGCKTSCRSLAPPPTRPPATSASPSSSSSWPSASSPASSSPRCARTRPSSAWRRCSPSPSAAAAGSRNDWRSSSRWPRASRSRPACWPGRAPRRRAPTSRWAA
jgi:ABC-2 type transport system permease protein